MSSTADLILFGGDIITMDEGNPIVEAVAIKGDRILSTGNIDKVFAMSGPCTQLIYLNEQTLLPGFIEPHQHAIVMVKYRGFINISGYYYDSYEKIEAKMKAEIGIAKVDAKADRVEWCVFFGWDPELIPDLPILSADFLDELSRDVPIVVVGQNFHVGWVNHKAFEIAGVDDKTQDTSDGVFVRDQHGHLTGKLFETSALFKVLRYGPRASGEKLRQALKDQSKDYASRGFTTVTDLMYAPDKNVEHILAEEAGNLAVRLALYRVVRGPNSGRTQPAFEASEKLWEAGVKLVADGSPHCGTAAVREPYFSSNLTELLGFPTAPSCGALNFTDEKLLEAVEFFHQEGKQIAIHAHGERAIDQVINVYEKVLSKYPEPKDMRHRIEHLGLATAGAIARAAQMDLALSFFVCHLYFYAKTFANFYLGQERTNRWTPLSVATEHGLRWTIHQDHPAFPGPPLPFANMKTAVTRTQRDDNQTVYGPQYRVSIDEALKAYTINAAWQLHKDDMLGSLTENKKADLVILSHNPYKVDPLQLEDIQVIDTFLDGRPINASEAYMTYSMQRPEGNCLVYKKKACQSVPSL